MFHDAGCGSVEVAYDSVPVASVLNVRGCGAVLSPLDPFDVSNSRRRSLRLVKCGALVGVCPIPQASLFVFDCPLDLVVLMLSPAKCESDTVREILLNSLTVNSSNFLTAQAYCFNRPTR